MKNYFFCALSLLLLLPVICHADSRDQLQQIKKRIAQTAGSLEEQKTAEKELLRDLSVVATSLKKIDLRIETLKKEQRKLNQGLEAARDELKESQQQMAGLEKKIHKRLVALYKEGDVGPLKLFFSSESPMELMQQYHYLTRVLEHDRLLIDSFRLGIEEQKEKQLRFESLQKEQNRLLEKKQQKRHEAADARQLYSQILERVRKDKKKYAKQLDDLKARAQRLEKLVKKLEAEQKEKISVSEGNFRSLKGKLPWPIKGSISIGFGRQKNQALGSVLESHGVEISYRSKQGVKAAAHGRIVFASWFKGYGNLMIVAHDSGFHTLYAQVDSIEANVGDAVRQGDVIAKTGDPGGEGVYFEIRHNGAPVDPVSWLRKK